MSWTVTSANNSGQQAILIFAELVAALQERCDAISYAMPAALTSINGQQLNATRFGAFHSAISGILARSGSLWEDSYGNPDTGLAWTEATILADIGDASRVPVPTSVAMATAWMDQQYDIIVRLIWRRTVPQAVYDSMIGYSSRQTGHGGTWAEAVADYDAGVWLHAPGFDTIWSYQHHADLFYDSFDRLSYQIVRYKSEQEIPVQAGDDVRVYGQMDYAAFPISAERIYECNDYPAALGEWQLVHESLNVAGPTLAFEIGADVSEDVTVTEPIYPPFSGGPIAYTHTAEINRIVVFSKSTFSYI